MNKAMLKKNIYEGFNPLDEKALSDNQKAYISFAQKAAVAEKKAEYSIAEVLWIMASDLAKHQDNREWALARSMFCERRNRYV